MDNWVVSVDNNSFDSAGITKNSQDAVCEFIWNALEASATHVDVDLIEDEFLTTPPQLSIIDDGVGIAYSSLHDTFGTFLSSQKKLQPIRIKTQTNKGKGRFSYLAISHEAIWETVCLENGQMNAYQIKLTASNKVNVAVSDIGHPQVAHTGTSVSIPISEEKVISELRWEQIHKKLLEEFAWYLYLNKDKQITITYCGNVIDYAEYLNTELSRNQSFEIEGNNFSISIVVWRSRIDNSSKIYYMTPDGYLVQAINTSFNKNAAEFYHGVFVKSDYFKEVPIIIDTDDASQYEIYPGQRLVLSQLKKEIHRLIDSVLREYLLHRADDYLKEEKIIRAFPTFEQNTMGETRKKDFKRVVREMYCIEPQIFFRLRPRSAKALFGFIELLLNSDERENIISVMEQIVELTPEQRQKFAKVLVNTKLEHIIDIVDILQQRYQVISELRKIVYNLGSYANERDHIQKIVESHFWMFGDQYSLVSADIQIKKTLKQFETVLGITPSEETYLSQDELRQRMDVVLYGSRFTDASKYEGLVIELKAPSVPLSVSVLSQIERYANIVRTEPRFSGNNRIWKFIAVCSRIEDEVASRFEGYKLHGKPGLVSMIGNFEIYAFTWDDIFLSFQQRYSFIIQKIKDDMENLETEIGPEEEISRELVTARVSALQNYSIAVNKNTEVSM